MAIDGFESVVVADNHVLAVAPTLVAGEPYFTREGSPYGIADVQGQVNPPVHAAATPAVVRSDVADDGHAVFRYVDGFCFGQLLNRNFVGVYPGLIPVVAVDVGSGELLLLFFEHFEQGNRIDEVDGLVDILLPGNEILMQFGVLLSREIPVVLGTEVA